MMHRTSGGTASAGFSLIETVIAMGILATGLLSLAGVFAMGLRNLAGSSANLIAREKAREAVESVHTARDTRVITLAQIRNVAHGGVFLKARSSSASRVWTASSTRPTTAGGPAWKRCSGRAPTTRSARRTTSRCR